MFCLNFVTSCDLDLSQHQLLLVAATPHQCCEAGLSWVGFLIAGTTWVCSVLITISILTDPSLDRADRGRVENIAGFFCENKGNNWEDGTDASKD